MCIRDRQQVKAMKQRLEEAENFYGSIRRVRHEMKNHMTNIKGLVASEKYDEVESYIEKLDETIQTMDYKFNTGNAVTDVIINEDVYKRQLINSLKTNGKEWNDIRISTQNDIRVLARNGIDIIPFKEENHYSIYKIKKNSSFLLYTSLKHLLRHHRFLFFLLNLRLCFPKLFHSFQFFLCIIESDMCVHIHCDRYIRCLLYTSRCV